MPKQSLGSFLKLVWTTRRWELLLVVSLIILFLVWKFNRSNISSYQGLEKSPAGKPVKSKKKHEVECRRIMQDLFKLPFSSVRPNFLKNPKTKRNLELDMYNPSLKLAVEYQGRQHREYTPYFHVRYQDFLDQLERDKFKKKRCEEEGIELICVPDTVKFQQLGDYLVGECKRRGKL
jgi:hypothetical protein